MITALMHPMYGGIRLFVVGTCLQDDLPEEPKYTCVADLFRDLLPRFTSRVALTHHDPAYFHAVTTNRSVPLLLRSSLCTAYEIEAVHLFRLCHQSPALSRPRDDPVSGKTAISDPRQQAFLPLSGRCCLDMTAQDVI